MLNDLALAYSSASHIKPSGPFAGIAKRYENYHNFFLLSRENVSAPCWPETPPVNLSIDTHKTYEAIYHYLANGFNEIHDNEVGQLMVAYPQTKSAKHLAISEKWSLLEPEKGDCFRRIGCDVATAMVDEKEAFWVYGEALLSRITKNDSSLRTFCELVRLSQFEKILPKGGLRESQALLTSYSFFGDCIPDAVMFVTLKENAPDDQISKAEIAMQGLSRILWDDRQAWLFRWHSKFSDAITRKRGSSRNLVGESGLASHCRASHEVF